MSTEKSPEFNRREQLALEISRLAAQGYRVESQSDIQATLVRGRRVNHILHLLLTLVTLGIWLLVWISLAIFGGEKRIILVVDEFGNTRQEQVGGASGIQLKYIAYGIAGFIIAGFLLLSLSLILSPNIR